MISPDTEAKVKNLIDVKRAEIDAEAIKEIGEIIFENFNQEDDDMTELMSMSTKYYFRDLDIKDVELLQGITFKAGVQLTEILERVRDLHRYLKAKEVKVNEPVSTGEGHGPETPEAA